MQFWKFWTSSPVSIRSKTTSASTILAIPFEHWLERTTVTEDRRNRDGVMVLGATAARGLSFRALFVLGMNEGVFPRTIREDAFLRDRDREVLETDLGYKVNQKLTGYDEEKLLFTLLVGAGRERLYCSYQRADDNGRALAPSWYVDELKQALASQGVECEVVTIPRSLTEKAAASPFDRQELLLPGELAVRLTLQNQDPTSFIEATGNLPALYQQGRKIVSETRSIRRSLVGLRRLGRRARRLTGNISPSAAYRRRRWKPTRVARSNFLPARCLAYSRSNDPKKPSVPMPPSSVSWAMKFSTAFMPR